MSKTVLVIEDDEMVLECITMLLQEQQLDVHAANNGLDGVALAQVVAPDLIMSDLVMEGYDGLQVLQAVRANPATARTPFVLITATADTDLQQRCYAMGVDQLLLKPFDPDRMVQMVTELLAFPQRAESLS
jgi:CheY-like chemotaxis protein